MLKKWGSGKMTPNIMKNNYLRELVKFLQIKDVLI